MNTHLFQIKCLTNLHVGSGDTNYNIIDLEVERDPILGEPTIHASGVKGALRDHCEEAWNTNKKDDDPRITKIFGSRPGGEHPGSYKFFSASMIARPLRVSEGDRSFVLVSTSETIETFVDFLDGIRSKAFDTQAILTELSYIKKCCGLKKKNFAVSEGGVSEIEGIEAMTISNQMPEMTKLIGNEMFALTDSLVEFDLPVLAHNFLNDNGISEHLWYEEIVPHKSVFYFAVLEPNGNGNYFSDFKMALEDTAVQFGGNASTGYGYATVKEIGNV